MSQVIIFSNPQIYCNNLTAYAYPFFDGCSTYLAKKYQVNHALTMSYQSQMFCCERCHGEVWTSH